MKPPVRTPTSLSAARYLGPAPLRRLLAVLVAAAASPTGSHAAETAPAPTLIAGVDYLPPGRAEKLDLYLPAPATDGKLAPAVVWIHGGGWKGGTRDEGRAKEICGTFAAAGYVAVSISYRLGDGAWPTNLHDGKNAVRFLRANAVKYRIDPARIAVAGGSAGGHLALMVGFTGDDPAFEPTGAATPYPGVSSRVRAVIDLYGITNLLTRQTTAEDGTPTGKFRPAGPAEVFGSADPAAPVYRAASPVTHVTRQSPPVLVLHGRLDTTVDYKQSEEIAHVLAQHGVPHQLVMVDGAGHTFDFEKWGKKTLSRDLRPVALNFLAQHLGP
jgi:acetyl esterase/lipase